MFSHIVRRDGAQEAYVILRVEFNELLVSGWCRPLSSKRSNEHVMITPWEGCLERTYINFHFPVETITQQQVVRHAYSVWLHRMTLAVVIVSDVRVVEVADTRLGRRH